MKSNVSPMEKSTTESESVESQGNLSAEVTSDQSSNNNQCNAKTCGSELSMPFSQKKRFPLADKRGSIVDEVRYLKQRASQLIVQVPVKNLKKIANTDGIHSLSKETQHFCGICTMHGPLRAYRGKHYSRLFWTTMLILNSILLVWQTSLLLSQYFANPTASQVLFILPEDGISFPSLTICNYNAIRKSYVKEINISGDFSQQMLNYIKQSYLEADTFYANAQIDGLEQGMLEYANYTRNLKNKNFSFHLFYNQSGFSCENMLKICTFGGKRFNCCELAEPILTTLGQCYLIQLSTAKDAFLQKQSQAGLERGLRIIADFHREEMLENLISDDYQPFMSNGLVNGFRYFVHGVDEISYLSHEGISVSPGFSIDTAIASSKFLLLDESQLGNCTNSWPDGYHSLQRYSAAKCRAFCRARYFNDKCNCSPFFYNIDNEYRVCSPYETYMCIYNKLSDSNKNYVPPKCNECKIECKRWVYHSYNSYGQGFSTDMLKWLHSQNPEWTPSHVRKNFVTINIAYMDMSYTLYSQVQTKSITEILSNIGGNMGLFFGMSVLSCFEIIMYLAKMTWIIISRKRRQYMYHKKKSDEEQEKRLKETINIVGGNESSQVMRKLSARNRFKHFGSEFAKRAWKASFFNDLSDKTLENLESQTGSNRNAFFKNYITNRLYNDGPIDTFPNDVITGSDDLMLELKINVDDLYRHRSSSLPIPCQVITRSNSTNDRKRRRRSLTTPPMKYLVSSINPTTKNAVIGNKQHKRTILDDCYLDFPEHIAETDEAGAELSPKQSSNEIYDDNRGNSIQNVKVTPNSVAPIKKDEMNECLKK